MEVVSEDTEFPADTETTVYLEGLKASDSLGGEKVTLQVDTGDPLSGTGIGMIE
ncbi:MAG: hypothetical protein ACON39_05250 [Coraliomargaritaceae bacterium]